MGSTDAGNITIISQIKCDTLLRVILLFLCFLCNVKAQAAFSPVLPPNYYPWAQQTWNNDYNSGYYGNIVTSYRLTPSGTYEPYTPSQSFLHPGNFQLTRPPPIDKNTGMPLIGLDQVKKVYDEQASQTSHTKPHYKAALPKLGKLLDAFNTNTPLGGLNTVISQLTQLFQWDSNNIIDMIIKSGIGFLSLSGGGLASLPGWQTFIQLASGLIDSYMTQGIDYITSSFQGSENLGVLLASGQRYLVSILASLTTGDLQDDPEFNDVVSSFMAAGLTFLEKGAESISVSDFSSFFSNYIMKDKDNNDNSPSRLSSLIELKPIKKENEFISGRKLQTYGDFLINPQNPLGMDDVSGRLSGWKKAYDFRGSQPGTVDNYGAYFPVYPYSYYARSQSGDNERPDLLSAEQIFNLRNPRYPPPSPFYPYFPPGYKFPDTFPAIRRRLSSASDNFLEKESEKEQASTRAQNSQDETEAEKTLFRYILHEHHEFPALKSSLDITSKKWRQEGTETGKLISGLLDETKAIIEDTKLSTLVSEFIDDLAGDHPSLKRRPEWKQLKSNLAGYADIWLEHISHIAEPGPNGASQALPNLFKGFVDSLGEISGISQSTQWSNFLGGVIHAASNTTLNLLKSIQSKLETDAAKAHVGVKQYITTQVEEIFKKHDKEKHATFIDLIQQARKDELR